MRFTTINDVIEAITPAFGEHGDDYDIAAIAQATHTWMIDTDGNGNELLNTAGFEQTVTVEEFWAIAAQHDTSNGNDDQDSEQEPSTTAWLTLDAGCLIHGEGAEVGILDYDDTDQVTSEPLAPVSLPVSLAAAIEDHEKAQNAAEARLAELGWDTVGDWDAVDTGYTVKVRRTPQG
ncbi:hypothetical protein [Streptomyces sp. C10-9-1]|uniref:hypothetical protein n=1 Tax=Streptomyces sp. C10-9-1 TaxID=1859285 RepID=UPI003D70B87E